MNRTPVLILFCTLLVWGSLAAQPLTAPADNPFLKAQVEARERRADLLLDEIQAADRRIEDIIDALLATLRSVGDSKDSRTKVARMKEQTIDALQKNVFYFQQRRAALQEELRRPTLRLTAEEKRRAITKFDERIEKRVRQIVELAKSLPTHKDYERYKVVIDERDWGDDDRTFVKNEDYKQNKRLTAHTNAQRNKIIRRLERSIERIDQQTRSLRAQMQSTATKAQRQLLAEEIAKNEALTKTRQTQLAETLKSTESPTRPISGKEAQDMDAALREAIDGLRRDFTNLFQLYSSYLSERGSANTTRAALEAGEVR